MKFKKVENSIFVKRESSIFNEQKNLRGITLISLIITIIVLLILSAVTINIVLGDNGIINKAKSSTQLYEKKALEEELQHIKAEALMDAIRNKKELTVEDYVKLLEDQGMIADKTSMANENDTCEIVTNNGYPVTVSKSDSGELVIVVGDKDLEIFNKKVEIENIELKAIGSTRIEAKVKTNGAVGVTYTYTCDGASNSPITTNKKTIEFTGLSASTTYTVKVVATNKNGNSEEVSESVTTGTVPAGKNNLDFETTWDDNRKAVVKITVKPEAQSMVSNCTLKWRPEGETVYRDLIDGKTSEVNCNDKIYAVFVNNFGDYDEINKEEYIVTETGAPNSVAVTLTITGNISAGIPITAVVNATDNESGVDFSKAKSNESKFLFSPSNIVIQDPNQYTGVLSGTINADGTISKGINTMGTYYLHVMVKDLAGNIAYAVSENYVVIDRYAEIYSNGVIPFKKYTKGSEQVYSTASKISLSKYTKLIIQYTGGGGSRIIGAKCFC